MSTALLNELSTEVHTLTDSGRDNLGNLLQETTGILGQLKDIESQLLRELESEGQPQAPQNQVNVTDIKLDKWYKNSLGSLKGYNGQTNRFTKHVLSNSKFNVNLDEAYTYPLNLDSMPVVPSKEVPTGLTSDELLMRDIKAENQQELMKAIVLHLLKIGQRDSIDDILKEYGLSEMIANESLLDKFGALNEIVDDIVLKHDLSKALSWFKGRPVSGSNTGGDHLEFKFHVLQFALLLSGSNTTGDKVLEAYRYSLVNFPSYLQNHLEEIGPLMTLTLFTVDAVNGTALDFGTSQYGRLSDTFLTRLKEAFSVYQDRSNGKNSESKFVEAVIHDFDKIENNQGLFQTLANEFISYYCKDLNLSNDSSLFQSLLAGYVNLPSFYKYNQIERKFKKLRSMSAGAAAAEQTRDSWASGADLEDTEMAKEQNSVVNNIVAPFTHDLPFHLPDSSRFLFKYHPIFICPVSKEQLVPITVNERAEFEVRNKRPKLGANKEDQVVRPMNNPVVVLKWCNHVALRDSVWQLSKRGSEIFKCHYCYTKHKFSEVSEAYFIDL